MVAGDNLNNNSSDVGTSDVGLIETRSDADLTFGDVLSQLYTPSDTSTTSEHIGDTLVADNDAGVSSTSQADAAEEYDVDHLGLPRIEIVGMTGMDSPFQNLTPRNQLASASPRREAESAGRASTPELASRAGSEETSFRESSPAGPDSADHSRQFIERAALASANPENMRDKLLTLADRLS